MRGIRDRCTNALLCGEYQGWVCLMIGLGDVMPSPSAPHHIHIPPPIPQSPHSPLVGVDEDLEARVRDRQLPLHRRPPLLQIGLPELVGAGQELEGALVEEVALGGSGLRLGLQVPQPRLERVGVSRDLLR